MQRYQEQRGGRRSPQVAGVNGDGDLYLAGKVFQWQTAEDMQNAVAVFEVRREDGDGAAALIDSAGNLWLLASRADSTGGEKNPRNGYLLLHGIPYNLDLSRCIQCRSDLYAAY